MIFFVYYRLEGKGEMLHYIKEILTNQITITNNICSIVYLNAIQSPSPIILSCQFLQTNVAGLVFIYPTSCICLVGFF